MSSLSSAAPEGRGLGMVVTCEHGGSEVPQEYRALFHGEEVTLRSHRGWDPGALDLARRLAEDLEVPLHFSTTTRLVADLNRSPGHPRLFSEFTRPMPRAVRAEILARHHTPYREEVARSVKEQLEGPGQVLHLSIHSFTPVLDGRARKTELALLYDPGRSRERELAGRWVACLRRLLPGLNIRRNHPYRGTADGVTTWLRGRLDPERYLGLEVEVSQGLLRGRTFPRWVGESLLQGLRGALDAGARLG